MFANFKRTRTRLSCVGCCTVVLLYVLLCPQLVFAQPSASAGTGARFELRSGDRVVFLGNSIFENDLRYGYIETALTTRWPDLGITYRNLGWTGDMVRGEARSTFTKPPTAYESLISQLKAAKPTVVFLAYGGLEAMNGEAGLDDFAQGLNQLIDTIDRLGARTVILSPLPLMLADSVSGVSTRQQQLELYTQKMAAIATSRNKFFVDIFHPIRELSKKQKLSENGIHLNENGYYQLAAVIEEKLGLPFRNNDIAVVAPKDKASFGFTVSEGTLPLTAPPSSTPTPGNAQMIRIAGLKKGFYALSAGNRQVAVASAKQWAEGLRVEAGPEYDQTEQLRELIIQKNEIFFQQYRPLNRTYILGFRSYEQGRHLKGLEDMDVIITWLESQIRQKQRRQPQTYTLSPVK